MKAFILTVLVVASGFLTADRHLGTAPVWAAGVSQSGSRCHNTQLTVHYQSSNGAAGHIGIIYRIHNLSTRACTLYGYPGVQLLDKNFQTLPTHVLRGGGFIDGSMRKQLVQLAAGGNAFFELGYSDVPVNNQPCRTARYLMVFAPNDVLPVVVYAFGRGGITSCTGNLDVSPVTTRPRFP